MTETNFNSNLRLLYVAANTDQPRLTNRQYEALEATLSDDEKALWDDYVRSTYRSLRVTRITFNLKESS